MADCLVLWSDEPWSVSRGNPLLETLTAGYQKYLGPYVIANSVRTLGFTAEVIDHTGLDYDQVWARVEPLLDKDTLWVGVSTTFSITGAFGFQTLRRDWRQILAFMARVRSRAPKCQFIAGGYFSSVWHRLGWWVLKNHSDESIESFTLSLKNPLAIHTGKIIEGNHNQLFRTRSHQWHTSDRVEQGEALPLEISRGCRFKCAFCRFSLNGRKKNDYLRDPACIKAELEANWAQWSVNRYTLADDTFNEDTDKLRALAQVVSELSFPVKFTAYIRVDLLESHPEQISILRDMGIENAMFGIESLEPLNGPVIGKARGPQRTIDFIAELKTQHWPGVGLHSGFILGLPWDRPQHSAHELVEWAVGSNCPLDSVSLEPLNIIRPAWRRFWGDNNTLSLFDADAEKYGYLWLDPTSGEWTNSNTGLSYSQVQEETLWATKQLFERGDRHRIAGFNFNRLLNLGIPQTVLETENFQTISKKWDLVKMTRDRHLLASSC